MSGPLTVLVNAGGGTAAARGEPLAGEIERAFAAAGRAAAVRFVVGSDIAGTVAAHASAETVVVGGGDGTLGAAAGALAAAGGKAALGILPLGTHNHLARDLGIPSDLAAAARIAAAGPLARIDLAEVNGRIFINNASIGLYPALVQRREAVRRRRGLGPKWLADLPAAWEVLARARHHRLRLTIEGDPLEVRTPLLFVGNNRYVIEPGRLGCRESLSDGLLSVFALRKSSRLQLLALAARTLAGRTDPDRDLAAVAETDAVTVRLHGATIEIALDGEVTRLAGPLRFAIRPGALRVRVPPA